MTNNYITEGKKNQAREHYDKVIEEFKSVLKDKTVPKNQTSSYKQNVITTLNRLMTAADDLDSYMPGQGIFGLIILSLRGILLIKDQNSELEVRIRDLEKEIKKIKKQ